MPKLSSPVLPALTLPVGMRSTRALQTLLLVLPAQPEGGWTQAMVEQALHQHRLPVNRVTVYRALDRLALAGVLERTVDAQRITRYWVADRAAPAPCAHMECKACHQPMALDASAAVVQAALQALRQAVIQTTGVHQLAVDVAVQAQCAQCANDATPLLTSNL